MKLKDKIECTLERHIKLKENQSENMWICHYNKGNGRDWFIIFKG